MLRTWRFECSGQVHSLAVELRSPSFGTWQGEKDFWFCLYCLYWTESFPGEEEDA